VLRTTRHLILAPLLALSTAAVTLALTGTGADAASSPTVRTTSSTLKLRSAPTTKSAQVGSVRNGTHVSIACQVTGEYVKGAVRKTNQWDRLTNGRYVSHAFVRSGTIGACAPPAPPAAAAVPGPVGTWTNAKFIAISAAPAQQGWREFGVPASVTMAQAILESGWGRSGLSANDRNYFGIKCFNQTPGPIHTGCHTYATYECQPTCAPTTASFRVYASMTDSFRDHGRFLTVNSRYKPAFVYTRDANNFVIAIAKAGYATSPTYAANLTKLMTQYNLYQYDSWK
jgi:flagellar protein FlgJ